MIKTLLRLALRLAFRLRVRGDASTVAAGGVIVAANHDSLLDGILLALFLPGAPLAVVTREALAHPLTRLLLRAVPHTVLDPARPWGVKHLVYHVRTGRTIIIFPQGRVTTTGGLMKVYDAAGVIASRCDADIVPVRIDGTLHSRMSRVGGGYRRRMFPRVTITIHAPRRLPPLPVLRGRERRRYLADAVLRLMQEVLTAAARGGTLFEAFLDAMTINGRKTAIIEDIRACPESYGDLLKSALALGRLTARYTGRHEVVGVIMPTMTVSVALVLGLIAMRRIPGMLNYTSGPDALVSACTAARIETIITSRRFVEMARIARSIEALGHRRILYV